MSIFNCDICQRMIDSDFTEHGEHPITGELICEKCNCIILSNIENNELLELCLEIFDKINIADYSLELYNKAKKIINKNL